MFLWLLRRPGLSPWFLRAGDSGLADCNGEPLLDVHGLWGGVRSLAALIAGRACESHGVAVDCRFGSIVSRAADGLVDRGWLLDEMVPAGGAAFAAGVSAATGAEPVDSAIGRGSFG
ncbi:hypothetical protein [Nocardia sp. NPDC057030]|uniref:hypothetical protein n=1 Tax=Nocardia sp. NPDC057030 TaxID=3346005 RepID=UPI003643DC10